MDDDLIIDIVAEGFLDVHEWLSKIDLSISTVEFSIRPLNLDVSLIGEWTKELSNIIAHIESEIFRENIDEMEATGSSNYRKHYFFGLDSLSLIFQTFSLWQKSD
jgi:hypothetical protein